MDDSETMRHINPNFEGTTNSASAETSDFFRALINAVQDYAIFALDPEGTILSWNLGAQRLYGYSTSEIIGHHFSVFRTPEDVAQHHPQEELKLAERDGKYEEEGWRVRKDGSRFWANVTLTALNDPRQRLRGFVKVTRDLTERKRLEQVRLEEQRQAILLEQIRKSKAAIENERDNFRNLFRQTPEMVCILKGPEHVFEFVNEAHIRTLGFDATGMSVRQAQPESKEVHGILDEVYRTGKTAELHEIPVTVTDRLRYFNLTYAARRDTEGRINGVMVLGVEVTDQLLSKESLRESEKSFRTLAEAIPQIIWTATPDGIVTYFNGRWLEYTGLTLSESAELGILNQVHPDDLKQVEDEWSRVRLTGDAFSCEYRLRRKDGTYRWFLGRATSLRNPAGRITHWFGTATDIDEAKRARITQAFLDNASLVLASTLDYRRNLQAVADLAISALADWCSIDILNEEGVLEPVAVAHRDPAMLELGRAFKRLYPVEMNAANGSAKVIRSGEPEFYPVITDELLVQGARDEAHLEMMRKLGLRSLMIVPLSGKERNFGALSFVLSGSERRYGPQDLAMARELARRAALSIENARLFTELRAAVQARDEFLSIASHELKTPLTPIKIQLQSLERMIRSGKSENLSAERIRKVLDISDRQLTRLAALVENLLDVARISTGRLRLNLERQDLAELIREICERYSPQASRSGISLEIHAPGSMAVSFDRLRIEQVIINLLGNAMKYAPGKPVTVFVEAQGALARVTVRDQGPGLLKEDIARIFERFERVREPQNVDGLGLGLYISRQIIEAHGGRIWAESQPGNGASFSFEVPLSPSSLPGRTI